MARDGSRKKSFDQSLVRKERMSALAAIFRGDTPFPFGQRMVEGGTQFLHARSHSGGQSTSVMIAALQPRASTSCKPICKELNCPRSGAGFCTITALFAATTGAMLKAFSPATTTMASENGLSVEIAAESSVWLSRKCLTPRVARGAVLCLCPCGWMRRRRESRRRFLRGCS